MVLKVKSNNSLFMNAKVRQNSLSLKYFSRNKTVYTVLFSGIFTEFFHPYF